MNIDDVVAILPSLLSSQALFPAEVTCKVIIECSELERESV